MISRWYPNRFFSWMSRSFGFLLRASLRRFSFNAYESSPSWSNGDCSFRCPSRGERSSLLLMSVNAAPARFAIFKAAVSIILYQPYCFKISSSSRSLHSSDYSQIESSGFAGTSTCKFSRTFYSATATSSFDGDFFGDLCGDNLLGVFSLSGDVLVFYFFNFFSGGVLFYKSEAGASGSLNDSTTPM